MGSFAQDCVKAYELKLMWMSSWQESLGKNLLKNTALIVKQPEGIQSGK
jgi:hypothetical protein